jgi:hypothetical protein
MNIFYFVDVEAPLTNEMQRHIIEPMSDGGVRSFPFTDNNPNKQRVDAWIAEGNTLEEWQPASEPVIEETPADSTDEEPVTEDGN